MTPGAQRDGTIRDWLVRGRFADLDRDRRQGYEQELSRIRSQILRQAEVKPGDVVLDLGCGTGFLLEPLASRAGELELIGIDVDPGVLREARRSLGDACRLIQASVGALPLADEAVSACIGRSVYLYVDDLEGAVAELARVLAPGGRLSLFEPLDRRLEIRGALHLPRELELMLLKAQHMGLYGRELHRPLITSLARWGISAKSRCQVSRLPLRSAGDITNRCYHVAPPGFSPVDIWLREGHTMEEVRACVRRLQQLAAAGAIVDVMVYGFFHGEKAVPE